MSQNSFDPLAAAAAVVAGLGQTLDLAQQKAREKRIYEALAHETLREGMVLLDGLHLIAMVHAFSGAPFAQVVSAHAASEKAAALAAEIDGLSLLTVNALIGNLRFAVLVSAFGHQPTSRFAAELDLACAASQAGTPCAAASNTWH